jgi:hypothetical protein
VCTKCGIAKTLSDYAVVVWAVEQRMPVCTECIQLYCNSAVIVDRKGAGCKRCRVTLRDAELTVAMREARHLVDIFDGLLAK